jgi:hypothetical protein
MSQTEGNYVPYEYAPFIWYPEPKSSTPSVTITLEKEPKKPIGFADWPEDPKPEWKKA